MSDQITRCDIGDLFPSPDVVGTTEYLAVHGMLTGAGYFDEGGDMEVTLEQLGEMYNSLDELTTIAREKTNLVYDILRKAGG